MWNAATFTSWSGILQLHMHVASPAGVNYKVLALDIPESDLPLSETGSPRKRLSVTGSAVSEQGAVLPTTMHKIGLPKPGPYHPGLKNGDESLPPEPLISQKSRRRDPADVILDMSPESLLNFPHDEEVVGIITMEDLIEELLQVTNFSIRTCQLSMQYVLALMSAEPDVRNGISIIFLI